MPGFLAVGAGTVFVSGAVVLALALSPFFGSILILNSWTAWPRKTFCAGDGAAPSRRRRPRGLGAAAAACEAAESARSVRSVLLAGRVCRQPRVNCAAVRLEEFELCARRFVGCQQGAHDGKAVRSLLLVRSAGQVCSKAVKNVAQCTQNTCAASMRACARRLRAQCAALCMRLARCA